MLETKTSDFKDALRSLDAEDISQTGNTIRVVGQIEKRIIKGEEYIGKKFAGSNLRLLQYGFEIVRTIPSGKNTIILFRPARACR